MVKSGDMNNTSNNIVSEVSKDKEFEKYGITVEKLHLLKDFIVHLTTKIEETYFGPEYIKSEKEIIDHYCWCCNKTINDFSNLGFNFNNDEALFEFLYISIYKKTVYNLELEEIDYDYIKKQFQDLLKFDKKFTRNQLDSVITLFKIFKKFLKS